MSGSFDAQSQSAGRTEVCLTVPAEMRDAIVEHLRTALPEEGCGLIGARIGDGGVYESLRFFPGDNINRSPIRFTMEPAQVIAAFKEMRGAGMELGAIVHSHPASPAVPSPTDVRETYYPQALALIVSFASGRPDLRAWRWTAEENDRGYRECRIAVVDSSDPASDGC